MNAQDILEKGPYHLIDLREDLELEMDGSLQTAIHIPMGDLEEKLDEIKQLEGNVVLFCRSGTRAGNAIGFLEQNGVINLYNAGGYKDLKDLVD